MKTFCLNIAIVSIYGLAFLFALRFYDKALRKKETRNRKTIEVIFCTIHTLCWYVLSFFNQEYMQFIIPAARTLLIFSISTVFEKDRDTRN